MDFTITSNEIVWLLALIGSIYTVYRFYKELKKPKEDEKKMLLEHERRLKEGNERFEEIEKVDKMMLQCMLCLINHDITGNGIEQLKHQRDELQEFLINK